MDFEKYIKEKEKYTSLIEELEEIEDKARVFKSTHCVRSVENKVNSPLGGIGFVKHTWETDEYEKTYLKMLNEVTVLRKKSRQIRTDVLYEIWKKL